MNYFDMEIIRFINQFSQVSWIADVTTTFISKNHLIKGGLLLAILWGGWFRANKNQYLVRLHLISTLFACFIAMLIARVLALLLPFRLRPMHEEGLSFTLPYGMEKLATAIEGWSSFPSDHAVLFYALSTGLFYISKKVGILAFIYTTVFISLPRVYLGLHYPTDIIVGAAIGIIIVLLCQSDFVLDKLSNPILLFSNKYPQIFYPIMFIVTYQIADMFDNSRAFFSLLKEIVNSF
ncbi:phosphatase PAP2 family protein [Thermodesulfobacteriota bacterium]